MKKYIKKTLLKLFQKLDNYLDNRKWIKLKTELLKGVKTKDLPLYNTVLENQFSYVKSEITAQAHFPAIQKTLCSLFNKKRPSWVEPFHLALLKISKKVLDGLVAREWVGIQPMMGPIGLAYTMQYRKNSKNQLSLEIISNAVEAVTQKLNAGWTIEAMQDMKTMHGLDLVTELEDIMASMIILEIESYLINWMWSIGTKHEPLKLSSEAPFSNVIEHAQKIALKINLIANEISAKTRRGPANFMITDPLIISILQAGLKDDFTPVPVGYEHIKGPNNTQLMGFLFKRISVYSTISLTEELNKSTILLGYKGKNGELDTGIIYMPYVLVMSGGVIINPITFQPVASLLSRFGLHLLKKVKDIVGSDQSIFAPLSRMETMSDPEKRSEFIGQNYYGSFEVDLSFSNDVLTDDTNTGELNVETATETVAE
ncbi:MAG TPA: hypothetical protein VJ201_08990 [Candidatus Babeliales bacterium]|nr:hypothetical protein [Candidatus Babeliales bacterium]